MPWCVDQDSVDKAEDSLCELVVGLRLRAFFLFWGGEGLDLKGRPRSPLFKPPPGSRKQSLRTIRLEKQAT